MPCKDCYNGCVETVSDSCVKYTGPDLGFLEVTSGDSLLYVISQITNYIEQISTGEFPVDINQEIICEWLTPFFPISTNSPNPGIGLPDILEGLIQAVCSLKEDVVALETDPTYDIACLTGVTSTSPTEDILQQLITQFCALLTAYTSFSSTLPTYTVANTGTGAQVYKDTTIAGTLKTFNLRKINTSNSGTGESVLKTVLENTNDISIIGKKLSTTNLNITSDANTIFINTPVDENLTQFYVNEGFTGTSNGSIAKPFKNLVEALVAVIGTGDITTPEFEGADIIMQTGSTVTLAQLTANPILQGKITVNTTTIKSDSDEVRTVIYEGVTEYPIDTDFMVNEVGFDGSSNLLRNIYINFDTIAILTSTVKGVVRSNSYSNGTVDISKPSSSLSFINGEITAVYQPPGTYVNAVDSTTTNISLFGQDVFVQDSIVNNTPHVIAFGKGPNGEGFFTFNNSTINGSSQTHFKLLNTSASLKDLNIKTVAYLMPTNDVTPVTPGEYLPKTDVYKVDVENSFLRIIGFNDTAAYAINVVDGNVPVGGTNSIFRATKTIPLSGNNVLRIDDGHANGVYTNYFLEVDKDFDAVEIVNCDFTSCIPRIGSFNLIGAPAGTELVYVEGSSLKNVKDPATTNIKPIATLANINNALYSTSISFANNADALAGGLIAGNIYQNSATNVMTKVI